MSGISAVANVVVPVRDQGIALTFYRDKLGFEVRADYPMGPGVRWIEVVPPGGSTTIALVPPRQGMWRNPGGETNINFECSDAVAEHARLRSLGVDVDEAPLVLGGGIPPMFTFRDPDGNVLHVVGIASAPS